MSKQVEMFEFDAATQNAIAYANLKNHIDCINDKAQQEMDMNPGLWISKITNDPNHWAEYGVTTPDEFDFYMDYIAIHDFIAEETSKSTATYILEGCKTVQELDDRYQAYRKGEL